MAQNKDSKPLTASSEPVSQQKPAEIETRLLLMANLCPAKKLSATISEADHQDVDIAVDAAKKALPAWSALGAMERAHYLFKLADKLDEAQGEIAYLDAISMGKPVGADAALAPMGPTALRYFAGRATDTLGDTSLNTANFVNMTFRQPYGVCGAIIPWNMPMLMLVMKVGPALVTGNTLVLKSSEKAPLSTLVFGRLCQEVGLPKGVLNLLSGYGRPCGEALAKHMQIHKLAFTGSAVTGKAIKKAAAESNLKNVTLELGGKSPLIIFEDADLEKAVPAAAFSILMNSGQACIASSRVYVHHGIEDKFIEMMKGAMTQMGHNTKGSDPTTMSAVRGPQADKIQFDRVMSYLNAAKQAGIETVLGGGRDGSRGYFIEPTILRAVPEDSAIQKEEIFGPVVAINTFTDEDDVLERANDTEYGLYASVFTKDIQRALRVAKKLEAGTIALNCSSPTMAFDMPFGGYKQSGEGRELSHHSMDAWTELKSVLIAL